MRWGGCLPPSYLVIPAKAGTQSHERCALLLWVPAFAGMTEGRGERFYHRYAIRYGDDAHVGTDGEVRPARRPAAVADPNPSAPADEAA